MSWRIFAIGSGLGVVAGLAHAVGIERARSAAGLSDSGAWRLWRGLWVLALWSLFGGYLLLLWLVGLVLRPVLALAGRRRVA